MFRAQMSRFALRLALFCAVAQGAQALELGETKAQLLKQNGPPGAEDHARNVAAYFWEGWSAQLEFQGAVVGKITYRRNWYLQDSEIASLLEANGGVRRWKETSTSNSLARQWARDDGASATCARVRPLSMVFQVAGLAAAYQQGPKVVAPGTPHPAGASAASAAPPIYTKSPSFPRPLAAVEPDLPVADPPAPAPAPVAPEHPLPKLKSAELQPAPSNTAPAPKPESPAANAPATKSPGAATGDDPNLLGYAIGSLACLAAFVLGGFYYFKWRARTAKPPPLKVVAVDSPSAASSAPAGLDSLRNDQVELLIGEIFRREGYTVELSAALNTDDGIDLMLRRDSETTLVQCKHWTAARVTAREARDFYGAMASGGAPHGILVTMGIFTPDALDFAPAKGIELLDGNAVAAKIAAVARPGENLCAISSWIDDFSAHARIFDPECPVCHSTMVIRHNRANGTPSWGCRNHPRCPGRREPRLDLLPSSTAS